MNKLILLIPLFLGTACTSSREYFPKNLPREKVEIIRFDKSLLAVQSDSALADIRTLYSTYPDFMPFFVENILGIPSSDTTYLATALPAFLNDTTYGFHATNLREQEMFQDVSQIEDALSIAFSRVHYLYPNWTIPSVTVFISGFNASILFFGEDFAVGTDMYLGSDYEYYNRVVNDYQKLTMRPECIPADVVSAWLFRNIPYTSTKKRLLENMIYRGKIMYFLSQLFPKDKPYETMGYTQEQWKWCLQYERAIWNRIMDQKDLFKTEQRVLNSYLNDGPFTSEISQDSPGRLGTWIGWRIVESYMEHNQDVSLQDLMKNGDAQKILEDSYYRP